MRLIPDIFSLCTPSEAPYIPHFLFVIKTHAVAGYIIIYSISLFIQRSAGLASAPPLCHTFQDTNVTDDINSYTLCTVVSLYRKRIRRQFGIFFPSLTSLPNYSNAFSRRLRDFHFFYTGYLHQTLKNEPNHQYTQFAKEGIRVFLH